MLMRNTASRTLEPRLSSRIHDLHSSPIRDILSVIDQPGMVSFAGGLPSADTFPDLALQGIPNRLLQYGPSEGEPELRRHIAGQLQALGLAVNEHQVIILSGSQQGIDLVAKLFVDTGTPVALESPCYLAALQAFRFFGLQAIPLDPDKPEHALFQGKQFPALAYINPTFQNPTGRCWTEEQRRQMADAADQTGTVIFEDDPYRDLVYDPVERTPVCAHLKQASWIYQGSFSKSMAPGLRIGFLAASEVLVPYLVRLKQAADLHSSRVGQWLVMSQLQQAGREHQLETLACRYREKRDRFQQLLCEHFDDLAHWELPSGGLFFWLRLKRPLDTSALLAKAIVNNVAFMPGEPFFIDSSSRYPAMRLNFSHADDDQMQRGLAVLADLTREGR